MARLVLRGVSTRAISDTLHISQHTVQDHLKAILNGTAGRDLHTGKEPAKTYGVATGSHSVRLLCSGAGALIEVSRGQRAIVRAATNPMAEGDTLVSTPGGGVWSEVPLSCSSRAGPLCGKSLWLDA